MLKPAQRAGCAPLTGKSTLNRLDLSRIVHDHDIARRQGWDPHLLDMGAEHGTVHGAVIDEGRGHAGKAWRAGEGRCLPVAMRHAGPAALAAWRSASQTGHLRR